jgi:6-phosphogluconolactonase (cycloisomerase 2 family)
MQNSIHRCREFFGHPYTCMVATLFSACSLAALALVVSVILAPKPALAYGLIQTLHHEVTGFEGLSEPMSIEISPDGRHLYVGGIKTLVVLERDQSTGTVEPLQTLEVDFGHYDVTFLKGLVMSPDGQNLYAFSTTVSALVVFARNPATGLLTLVEELFDDYNGVEGLRAVVDLEISSDGRHLYTLSLIGGEVAVFARDLTLGSLTQIDLESGIEEVPGFRFFHGAALAPDGGHLYVANRFGKLLTYSRDPESGELTFKGVLADDTLNDLRLMDLVIDPSGQNLYLLADGSPTNSGIIEFGRDPASGALVRKGLVSDFNVIDGFGDRQLLVDRAGSNVYITTRSRVDVFARSSQGELTHHQTVLNGVDGVEGLSGSSFGVLDPQERFLYLPSQGDQSIVIFERAAATGGLTFAEAIFDGDGATLDGLGDSVSVYATRDGKDVYALGRENQALAQYRRNAAGFLRLGQVISMRELGLEYHKSVAGQFGCPTGRHLFVYDDGDDLWVFKRGADGELTLQNRQRLNGVLLENGGEDRAAFSPDSRFFFTSNEDSLAVWDFDGDSGKFTLRTETYWGPVLFWSLAVGPQGRMIYGGERAPGFERARITVAEWDETTNSLTLQGDIGFPALGDEVRQLSMTPDGRHLIAIGAGETSGGPSGLVVFARDASTGMLTKIQALIDGVRGVTGLANPILGALSPSGTRLVVGARASQRDPIVSNFFARNPVNGRLTLLEQRVVGDGSGPAEILAYKGLAWSPAGDQFYVASRTHDTLFAFDDDALDPCVPGLTTLCLGENGRFQVEVAWRNFEGETGFGTKVTESPDSGLFWFFDSANWEMLVKVVNGCDFNGHFWVFAAATTNVDYTLTVTDTLSGTAAAFHNPLGVSSTAIADTQALPTCP